MEVHQRRLPPAGFGEMLRTARERRGLRVCELARALRVVHPYISNLERDRRVPSVVIARQIARLLEMTEEEQALLFSVAVNDAGRGSRRRARAASQPVS